MTDSGGIEIPADSGAGNDSGQGNSGGINPAWNEVLGVIPQDLHSQITPHLQKWDQGVQNKIQSVHNQYANYKSFVDNQVSPQDLQMGYGLVQALNQDPRKVYEAIGQHFGLTAEEVEEVAEDNNSNSNLPPEIQAKLKEFESFQQNVSSLLLKQQEEALERQASEKLDKELKDLKSKHGDFDEYVVLSLMSSGLKGEEAVARYQQIVNGAKAATQRPQVPPMLGGNSSIPQGGRDPAKLQRNEVRNLIAQYLERGG